MFVGNTFIGPIYTNKMHEVKTIKAHDHHEIARMLETTQFSNVSRDDENNYVRNNCKTIVHLSSSWPGD